MDEDDEQTEAERTREIHLSMDLILRIGEMLLSSGAGAADVTATMRSVADHLGLRQADVRHQLVHGSLAPGERVEDRAPAALSVGPAPAFGCGLERHHR